MMRHIRQAVLAGAVLAGTAQGARAELYEDLGGDAGLQAIVDQAVPRWLADPLVGPSFAETNMTRFRRLLLEQLCQLSGGPCSYSGRDMARSHQALGLRQVQFNALAEDLQDAMEEVGVPYHTQNRLLAKLAPMQRDTVTR